MINNDNFFKFHGLNFGSGYWFLNETNCLTLFDFVLRNNIEESSKIQKKLRKLKTNIYKSSMSFEISDNLGNSSSPIIVTYKGKCSNDNVDICIGCDWPIYCHRYSDALDIYGITANEGSYNINFMGGSKGFIDGDVCVFISKFLVKQYERSDKSKYKLSYGWSNPHPYQRHSEDKYIGCVPFYNYIFSSYSPSYIKIMFYFSLI